MDGGEGGGERLVIQVAFTKSVASPTSNCVSASIGSAPRSTPATATLLTRDGNAGQLRRHLCTPVEVTPRKCESGGGNGKGWRRPCLIACCCVGAQHDDYTQRTVISTWAATLTAANVTQTQLSSCYHRPLSSAMLQVYGRPVDMWVVSLVLTSPASKSNSTLAVCLLLNRDGRCTYCCRLFAIPRLASHPSSSHAYAHSTRTATAGLSTTRPGCRSCKPSESTDRHYLCASRRSEARKCDTGLQIDHGKFATC